MRIEHIMNFKKKKWNKYLVAFMSSCILVSTPITAYAMTDTLYLGLSKLPSNQKIENIEQEMCIRDRGIDVRQSVQRGTGREGFGIGGQRDQLERIQKRPDDRRRMNAEREQQVFKRGQHGDGDRVFHRHGN